MHRLLVQNFIYKGMISIPGCLQQKTQWKCMELDNFWGLYFISFALVALTNKIFPTSP